MEYNFFQFFYDFFIQFLAFASNLWDWLFGYITIGDMTFQIIWVISGGLIFVFFVMKLIKDFIPVA